MENGPFIDDFPIKSSIYKGFSMATLNNQMVHATNLFYLFLGFDNHQTTWVDQATTAGATEGGRPRLVRTGERLTAGHGAQDVTWHGC